MYIFIFVYLFILQNTIFLYTIVSLFLWERFRMAQRQNDTVVKTTRCVTLARMVTLAWRQNDTVCQFSTATK